MYYIHYQMMNNYINNWQLSLLELTALVIVITGAMCIGWFIHKEERHWHHKHPLI